MRKQVSLIELLIVSVILGILAMAVIDLQSVTVARKKESQLRDHLVTMRGAITDFTTETISQVNIGLDSGFSAESMATAIVYLRPRVISGTFQHQSLVQYCINKNYFATKIGQEAVPISTSTGPVARLPGTMIASFSETPVVGSYSYEVYIASVGVTVCTMPLYLRKTPINPYEGASWTYHFIATGSLSSPAFALTNITPYGLDDKRALDGTSLVDF